jgi:hypothetical protein
MKKDILKRLNEIIEDEKGSPVGINDMFMDSDLDSLGVLLTIVTLDADYPFLPGNSDDDSPLADLDVPNLTVRDLVKKCVLSITATSNQLSEDQAT